MKVTSWERELNCRSCKEHLFIGWHIGSRDSKATIGTYGLFQVRGCKRCGCCVEQRYLMPESVSEVRQAEAALESFRFAILNDDDTAFKLSEKLGNRLEAL